MTQPTLTPGIDLINDSTVQSAVFTGKYPTKFGRKDGEGGPLLWHVVVRSDPRLSTEGLPPQRYALVLSLEHSDQTIRLYQRVQQRVRIRQRG